MEAHGAIIDLKIALVTGGKPKPKTRIQLETDPSTSFDPECFSVKSCPGDGNCSGSGVCDTQSGTCLCNPGFQGSMCKRELAWQPESLERLLAVEAQGLVGKLAYLKIGGSGFESCRVLFSPSSFLTDFPP